MYMWYMQPGHLWKPYKRLPCSSWTSVASPLVCVNIPAISHFWVCATRRWNTFTMRHNFTPCVFKILCTSLDSEESLNCIYARYEVVDKNIKTCMYVQNDINIEIHISTPTVTNFWYYTSQLFPNYHICSNILFIFLFCCIVSNALEERREVTEIIKWNYSDCRAITLLHTKMGLGHAILELMNWSQN